MDWRTSGLAGVWSSTYCGAVIWLSAVLVALVSNLDNLAAGLAFGLRDRRVAATPNAVIAGMTMAGTAAAMTSGEGLSSLMPPSTASAVGASIIIAIGVGSILSSPLLLSGPARVRHLAGDEGDHAVRERVSLREALVLGVALSLNNVASGVGAGVAGVSPLATTLLAGAFSLLCVGGGSRLGWSVGRVFIGEQGPLVAGLLLIGVGAAVLSGAG